MSKPVTKYLSVTDPDKQWVVDELNRLLLQESILPAFPEVASKLIAVSQREDSRLEEFCEIISLDPGLTTRCIQVASSVAFAARPIDNINQALMLLGAKQTRRIALAVAAIGCFAGFKGSVDWRKFWFHNVLVGRLTEKVAGTFRRVTGLEYLAGLLHDMGKLILEHYFRGEFERVVTLASERDCSHATVEREILGLDHTQIGAAMCDFMNIHPHIQRAVLYHHDPLNVQHTADAKGDGGFLATCIQIADRLTNNRANYVKNVKQAAEEIEASPEWRFLQHLFLPQRIVLSLEEDVKQAHEDLTAFLS